MEKVIQDKKETPKKIIKTKNKEVYKHLASIARQGRHAEAVKIAKKIFFVQFRKEPLTSAEASELIRQGMSH